MSSPNNGNNGMWNNCSAHSSPCLCQNMEHSPYQSESCYYTPLNLTPHWPEDTMSVCSSTFVNTPELESQTLIEGLLSTTTAADATMVDPQLFAPNTYSVHHHQQDQQLMEPVLQFGSPQLLAQKSNYYPAINTLGFQQQYSSDMNVAAVGARSNAPSATSYYGSYSPAYEPPSYQTATASYTNAHNNNTMYHTPAQNYYHHVRQQQPPPPPPQQPFSHYIPFEDSQAVPPNTINKNTQAIKGKHACTAPGCNKVFPRSYNLKSHQRTHTQERPYHCQNRECQWSFARIHDLKRHELQHTGVKPHSCEFCHRKFARSDALKRHWKVDAVCADALEVFKFKNNGKEPIGNRKRKAKATKN